MEVNKLKYEITNICGVPGIKVVDSSAKKAIFKPNKIFKQNDFKFNKNIRRIKH